MHRTSPRLALLAAAIAAFLLAGCGTSGGDDAADSPTTTKAESVTTTAPIDTTPDDTTETTADTTDTTEAPEPGGDDICAPLKVLSDFDIQSAELINGGDWPATQAFFVENTDAVLAAYDEAIAMETDLADDLRALRDVTETTAETAADAGSIDEFAGTLLAQPGIMEAGTAGMTLNEFAESNCGFSTGGNGQ